MSLFAYNLELFKPPELYHFDEKSVVQASGHITAVVALLIGAAPCISYIRR
jgi:hypothetical protein